MCHDIENEKLLAKITHTLIRRLEPEGILVHGSRAKKRADLSSDVDLFLFSPGKHEGSFQYHHVTIDGIEADLSYCSYEVAAQILKQPNPKNNFFLLNVFIGGRTLFDPQDKIFEIRKLAKLIWDAGPTCPNTKEEKGIRQGLPMALASVQRTVERSRTRGQAAESLAVVACSNLFMKAVYGYCRLTRLWTCGLPELIDRLRANPDVEISAEIEEYLASESLGQRISVLTRLIQAVSESTARFGNGPTHNDGDSPESLVPQHENSVQRYEGCAAN